MARNLQCSSMDSSSDDDGDMPGLLDLHAVRSCSTVPPSKFEENKGGHVHSLTPIGSSGQGPQNSQEFLPKGPQSFELSSGLSDDDVLDEEEDDSLPDLVGQHATSEMRKSASLEDQEPPVSIAPSEESDDDDMPPLLVERKLGMAHVAENNHSGNLLCRSPRNNDAINRGCPMSAHQGETPQPFPYQASEDRPKNNEESRLLTLACSRRKRGDYVGAWEASIELSEMQLKGHKEEEAYKRAEEAKADAQAEKDTAMEAEAWRCAVKALVAQHRVKEADEAIEDGMFSLVRGPESKREEAILQLTSSETMVEHSRTQEAHSLAQKALKTFEELADRRWSAITHETIAAAMAAAGKLDKAIKAAQIARGLHKELKCSKRESATLRTISRMFASKGDVAEAARNAQESHTLCQEIRDRRGEAAALECLAGALLTKRESADEAYEAAAESATIYKDVGELRGQVNALHTATNALVGTGEVESATLEAKTALEVAREAGDSELIGSSLELYLNLHIQNGLVDKALHIAQEELELARASGNRLRHAIVLQKLASAYNHIGQPKEGYHRAKEALDVLRNANMLRAEAQACCLLADHLVNQKMFDEAVTSAREAESLYAELSDVPGRVQALQLVTTAHVEKGDTHGAIQSSWMQREVYLGMGYKHQEASTLLGIADFLELCKGPSDALGPAMQSRDLFKELGDVEGEAGALLSIAKLQMALKRPTDAFKSIKVSRTLSEASGDQRGQAAALQTLADIYLAQLRPSEALREAKAAQDLLKEAGDLKAEAVVLQSIAQIYLCMCVKSLDIGRASDPSQLKEAQTCAEKACSFYREAGDADGQASSMSIVSTALLYAGDAESALCAAQESLEAAQSNGNAAAMTSALVCASQAYSQMGKRADAMIAAQDASAVAQETGDAQASQIVKELLAEVETASQNQRNQQHTARFGRSPATTRRGPSGGGIGSFGLRGNEDAADFWPEVPEVPPRGGRAGGFRNTQKPLFERQSFGLGMNAAVQN